MLSLKVAKYFKVCYYYCPQKSICFIYPVYFFSLINLKILPLVTILFLVLGKFSKKIAKCI